MTRVATIAAIYAAKAAIAERYPGLAIECPRHLLEGLTDKGLANVLASHMEDLELGKIGQPKSSRKCRDCRHYPLSRRKGIGVCGATGTKVFGSESRDCFERRPNTKQVKTTGKGRK